MLFIFESQAPSAAHSLIWSHPVNASLMILFTTSKILATQEFSQVRTFAVLPIMENIGIVKIQSLLHHKCCLISHECLFLSIFSPEKISIKTAISSRGDLDEEILPLSYV